MHLEALADIIIQTNTFGMQAVDDITVASLSFVVEVHTEHNCV